ncbi:type VI secretion system tube protein TssD [Hymenobacter terrenus]|uniref:type VI secretion system tube protein TssD n=1 Tax=Hymenobacter terrenus TaxID=1629124 RepID=UPI0006192D51|nr:type VI secretion system tube protein TssD [Hymenobacter terrenus]
MLILTAELQIVGRCARCTVVQQQFSRSTDDRGRPSSTLHGGYFSVLVTGAEAAWPLWQELMFDSFRRESGHLLFRHGPGTRPSASPSSTRRWWR